MSYEPQCMRHDPWATIYEAARLSEPAELRDVKGGQTDGQTHGRIDCVALN